MNTLQKVEEQQQGEVKAGQEKLNIDIKGAQEDMKAGPEQQKTDKTTGLQKIDEIVIKRQVEIVAKMTATHEEMGINRNAILKGMVQ